jgi:peptidoglycan/LPS O-acetylase OafA/YrhL
MESIMSRIGSRRGLLAAASGFVGFNAFYLWKVHFLQFGAIVAAAGIILAAAISYRLAQASVLRWLQTLGNLSMPIYLMHILCASGTRIILVKLLGTGNVYIHAVLGCAAGIFLPVLFYKAVTKIRANTLLFGR